MITIAAVSLLFIKVGYSHSPHDVIDHLEISPDYEQDRTVFIIISDHIRKSTNGGYNWKELVNGLDNKHLLSSIAISPLFKSDKMLFVSSRGDGIYRSNDGGKSWQKADRGLDSQNIANVFIPSTYFDGTVLAAGAISGLYQTKNKGDQWAKVLEQAKITALAYYNGPDNIVVIAGDSKGNLYHSQDLGNIWEIVSKNGSWGSINSIAIASENGKNPTIFIGTQNRGILKSNDKGVSFIFLNNGIPDQANIQSIALTYYHESNLTIFASTWNEAVFCSTDGGKNWKKYDKGLTKDSQADSDEYRSPHFRDIRITNSFKRDKTVFVAGFDGLFKTSNAGLDWAQLETLPLGLIKALSISPGNRNNSAIAIGTYGGGAYVTKDQGVNWIIANKGLRRTRLTDIIFSTDYETDGMLYAAHKYYILTSASDGESWDRNLIVPESWRTKLNSFVGLVSHKLRLPTSINKKAKDIILNESEKSKPYPSQIVISPNFKSDKTIYFGTRINGIYKSIDGGINSVPIWKGIKGRAVTSLAISPEFGSDRTLFASFRGKGIYRTFDGGASWEPANDGLSFISFWENSPDVHAITMKDTKLVISPAFKFDKTVFAGCSEGLFKSSDGTKKWVRLVGSTDLRDFYIIGIAISPNYRNDHTLIISVRGKGLFRSINGGLTFDKIGRELLQKNYAIRWIEFSKSYAKDNTIYAASEEELFRSEDRGETWRIIKRPVRYENHREVIQYQGKWKILKGENYSASKVSVSHSPDAKVTFNFTGTGISLIGMTAQDFGIAEIYLDDKFLVNVDQHSTNQNFMKTLYSVRNLSPGLHSIAIKLSESKNEASRHKPLAIDAFDVYP
jgi:photosystem II stability/assembly factor-like uncharacterized protein